MFAINEDTLAGRLMPRTALDWILAVVVTSVAYGACYAIYNLYLHPLASFPGPKLAAITRLYYVYQVATGAQHRDNLRLHKKYGSVVRIAPDELSFDNAEAWSDIYGARTGKPEMLKAPHFYKALASGAEGLLTAPRERHTYMRRLIGYGFSDKSLREQEIVLQSFCDKLMNQLHKRCEDGSASVDVVSWYNFFTFDVIGDLVFGASFGNLDDGALHAWVALIFGAFKASAVLRVFGYYLPIGKLTTYLLPRKLKEARSRNIAYTDAKVRERRNMKTKRRDLFSGFVAEENDVSEAEMIATARTIIIAGSETTATLLSGITFLLLKDRRVLNKLVEEIRSTFQKESDITFVGVNQLTYMLACLDEAMRVYPPVPGIFPRIVPAGGDRIGHVFVPEKTTVGVTQFAAYHDEANFLEPEVFIPERWLGDERFAKDNRLAFQPFALGPRNCVGKNLAYVEMKLVLARLIWNFDLLQLDAASEAWLDQDSYTLWEKSPLLVKLKPVKRTP